MTLNSLMGLYHLLTLPVKRADTPVYMVETLVGIGAVVSAFAVPIDRATAAKKGYKNERPIPMVPSVCCCREKEAGIFRFFFSNLLKGQRRSICPNRIDHEKNRTLCLPDIKRGV